MSGYPPGVTGHEYAIGGATHEWEAVEVCPSCDWEGMMHHEAHPEFGVIAWCGNPDEIDGDVSGERMFAIYCPRRNDPFEVEPDEPDYPDWGGEG